MGDGSTTLNGEFTVNTETTGNQYEPAITALNDGGYVIVWRSGLGQDGDEEGVFAQRYDADGVAVGIEFQINTYTADGQQDADIAYLDNGGFIVTWQSTGQDTEGLDPVSRGIFAQMYDSTGALDGSEFQVNSYTTGDQDKPKVTSLDGGKFVIIWHSNNQAIAGNDIYGQMYNADGTVFASEFLINTVVSSFQSYPEITALSDGGFVVTWSSLFQAPDGFYNIFGQRFDAAGAPNGVEFQINTVMDDYQNYPVIAGLEDGGFVATWESSNQDGSEYGIYAQIYDAAGATVGVEFLVNTYTDGTQTRPAIAGLADGGFIIVWTSDHLDGDPDGAYAQRYDAAGEAIGDEFLVAAEGYSNFVQADVTGLADGGYTITWSSSDSDGHGRSVQAQQYAAELWGTNESDTITDEIGANWLSGRDGGDTLKGKAGKDFIYGGNGNDTLFGGTKRDKLYGDSGKDDLIGGSGNDVLRGNNGNDDLLGGLDRDTLYGGNGDDTFIYEDVGESTNNSQADTIKDFVQGEDLIDLSAMGGLTFIGASGFSGTGGAEVRTGISGPDTLVRVDIDGDGSADMKVIVSGVTGLIIDDFIL